MKTVNHLFKVVRLVIILILGLSLLSLCLIVLFQGGDSEIKLMALFVPASVLLGFLLGQEWQRNRIIRKIVSAFNAGVKIAAQGSTVITGKVVIFTNGLKFKGIVVERASFKEEPATADKATHRLIIGDPRLLK